MKDERVTALIAYEVLKETGKDSTEDVKRAIRYAGDLLEAAYQEATRRRDVRN